MFMRLVIDFERPPGASIDDVADFVHSALSSWGGGLHPEDSMFHSLRDRMRYMTVHGKKYLVTSSGLVDCK
jgi:hypothetical protein